MPLMRRQGQQRLVPDHAVDRYQADGWTTPGTISEVERPARSDLKAVWVDYAVSQGAARDEAQSMTKAELHEKYG